MAVDSPKLPIQDHHDEVAGPGVDERLQPLDDIAVRPVHHKHNS